MCPSGSTSISFEVSREFPLVTLVTMLAPSPDWFAGVSGLSLFENGNWVNQKVVTLHAYDAGTDSGAVYTSPNQNTVPQETIRVLDTGAFANGMPIGTYTFTRLTPSMPLLLNDGRFQVESKKEIKKGDVIGHPNNAPTVAKEFTAQIIVLQHPTVITKGYTPVFHIHTAHIAGRITEIVKKMDPKTGATVAENPDTLKTGDAAIVKVQPLQPVADQVIREGITRGIDDVDPLLRDDLYSFGQGKSCRCISRVATLPSRFSNGCKLSSTIRASELLALHSAFSRLGTP